MFLALETPQSRPIVPEVPDSLFTDAGENKIKKVCKALDENPDLINERDESGLVLLHYAIDREHVDLASILFIHSFQICFFCFLYFFHLTYFLAAKS